jgi:CheY-like chemotaxis protein
MNDKQRILVVEDEPISRQLLSELLRMAGYDVVAAHSGEEALLTVTRERGRLDGLFTAVDLPGLVDGWMVADEFRSAQPARPVVFASAADPVQARPRQGVAFVRRPTAPPEVVEALNEVMRRPGPGAAGRGPAPRLVAEAPVLARVETPAVADPEAHLGRAVA